MRSVPCGGTIMAALLLLATTVVAQAPPVPPLALDRFPPAARAPLADAYRNAVERQHDAAAAAHLARLLHAWEQWDAAHGAYARAQALAPEAVEWLYLDAVVLQRLARHAEAVTRLRRVTALKPDYLPARMRLAEALFEMGELGESRPLFEALVREPAAEPAAEVGLGRIAAAEARHDAAVRHFERAVALFPGLGAAHYGLARSYRAVGRRGDAERALQQHAAYGARWPRLPDPLLDAIAGLREDARAVLQRAVALAETGDVEGSVAAHEEALARDGSLTQAHANLVSLYGRLGDWDQAERHYRAAAAAGLDSADPHYDFAVVLSLQEKWDLAETAYRKALEVNPLHAPARNNLGQIFERRREYDAACQEYRRAVDAQPAFRLARFNLGRMLLVRGETHQAIDEFEKLQQPRDAETPRYLFALATAHVRAGNRDQGISLAEDARRMADELGQSELAAAIAREVARLR